MAMNRHIRLFALGLLLATGARHAPAAATVMSGTVPRAPVAAARPSAFAPPAADPVADDIGWAARPRGLEIRQPASGHGAAAGPVPEPED
jgi:hypothetical protein